MNYITTAKEALECLKYHTRSLNQATELAQANNMALAALEKQIAKKPIPIGSEFDPLICPDCEASLDIVDYCIECGQKIDWSDEE